MSQSPRHLVWTADLVRKFWDYQSGRPEDYFTYQMGSTIASRLQPFLNRRSRVLDFGCGAGYLIGHLLNHAGDVAALDFSPESVAAVNQQFGGRDRFAGAFLPDAAELQGATFDAVFCVEVVEHLYDDQLHETLARVRELLSPDGVAIFTTPNREDLAASEVYCPVSDVVFHRWQHVRSWDRESLSNTLRTAGFRVRAAFETDFSADVSRNKRHYLRFVTKRALRRTASMPHLVAVAET